MKKNFKLGVIGCGFMATAIIEGALNGKILNGKNIFVANNVDAPFEKMNSYGIKTTFVNSEVASDCDFLLLSVKPQHLDDVAKSLFDIKVDKIISILAGVTKDKIKKYFPNAKVARCMPNTPCSISSGAVALDLEDFNKTDKQFIVDLFSALGEVVLLPESKMNAVTGVSGSGPAYVYLFIKGLIEAGVNQGLTYDDAKILAVNTVIGAGKMVLKNNDKNIDQLIDAVCSKGGTTIEAIKTFNEYKFTEIIDKAVTSCVNRAYELGGENTNNNQELPIVDLYTDGACSGNPGAGGWACVLLSQTKKLELSGGEEDTTNNRMELKAVIEGLKILKRDCKVNVYTDSSYVCNAFLMGWLDDWKKNNWKTASGGEVKNVDLWKDLLTLTEKYQVVFNKVKGHADNEFNNLCDKLAVAEWKKIKKE